MKKIYLASPFFNEKEIERMSKVLEILREKNLDVFAPYENQHKELEFGTQEWRDTVFKSDVNGIDTCDMVVSIISQGNYSDSGTAWELGYAYAKNIPTMVINLSDKAVNLMIANGLDIYIGSLEELKEYDFEKMEKRPYLNYVW